MAGKMNRILKASAIGVRLQVGRERILAAGNGIMNWIINVAGQGINSRASANVRFLFVSLSAGTLEEKCEIPLGFQICNL
jgi:hypothetical protein